MSTIDTDKIHLANGNEIVQYNGISYRVRAEYQTRYSWDRRLIVTRKGGRKAFDLYLKGNRGKLIDIHVRI